MRKINCYRIRRSRATKGGAHQYHHADIEAYHWKKALKEAKSLEECEWEWIDSFDKSDEDYVEYEYMYKVD